MARSPTASSLLLFFLSSSLLSVALSAEIRITDAQGLIELSNNVNSGTSYSGTTVFLDSDIDFSGGYSEQFAQIGNSSNGKAFLGTFDGQGHTISSLKTNSSSQYTGIFGYSYGTTIKNVVIDGSCSFVSSYITPSDKYISYIGSIIGYCLSVVDRICIIDNVVNMGGVSFEGNVANGVWMGGIIGYLESSNRSSIMRNCVNYGSVTRSGSCGEMVSVGGVAGAGGGKNITSLTYIQNCLNYGTIASKGVSKTINLGGIAGSSWRAIFENCVNSGAISSNQETKFIGGIIGLIPIYSEIMHCFWTSDAGNVNVYGYNSSNVDVTGSSLATLDQTTLDELNKYITEEKKDSTWSRWVMLHMNGGRINNISQQSLVEIQKHFPEPVREGNAFLFWCNDVVCSEVFDPETDNISDVSTLYAGWEINNYAVTFDLGNGTVLDETFAFNTSIEYPKGMMREGYTFNGWDSMPELMPAVDITIKAQWTEKVESKAVEIVFDTKDITSKGEEEMKEEIRGIIRGYTNENFVIERIDTDQETGELKVIIKFVDEEKAAEFVRVVNENKSPNSLIKRVLSYVEHGDFSSSLQIFSLSSLIFMDTLFLSF